MKTDGTWRQEGQVFLVAIERCLAENAVGVPPGVLVAIRIDLVRVLEIVVRWAPMLARQAHLAVVVRCNSSAEHMDWGEAVRAYCLWVE